MGENLNVATESTMQTSSCFIVNVGLPSLVFKTRYGHETDNGLTDGRRQPSHIWPLTRADKNYSAL